MKRLSSLKNSTGAVTIVVAFAIAALMAITALIVDVGLLYQERRQLQTAVDAAALAAAQDLAEGRGEPQAELTAERYLLDNSATALDFIEISYPTPNQVGVTTGTTRKFFFARIFGREKASLKANATAAWGPATSVRNLVPIMVPLSFISSHIGEGNTGSFELGADRPAEAFRKSAIQSGNTIQYAISYTNTKSGPVSIQISDPIPTGATYVEGSASSGGTYDAGTSTITWYFPNLPGGDTITVTFIVTVSPDSTKETKNTAYLTIDGSSKTLSASVTGATPQKSFFWLSDFNAGAGGTPDYADWIINGYPEEVGIGLIANGEGVRAALKAALEQRLETDDSVILPLYDVTEGGGSPGKYHIVGFAEFVIKEFNLTGNPKTITGYFTNGTVTSGAGGEELPPYDFGIKAIWLID